MSAIALFLYSFTQVDLSLTLSQWSVWQVMQKFFQNIGYFERPLSAYLFSGITISLFVFFILILNGIKNKIFSKKNIWILILIATAILTFSYNAFSYDLFNYIFDAKIVTHYQQNPYLHRALDYAGDPMLSFMHWTHRTYPYGPVWLGLTVPLSFMGMQFFLPTFFLFKIFISLTFLGSAFFVSKIMRKINPQNEAFGLALFALNPLAIVESLVSSHLDIVMVFFSLWSFYNLLGKRYVSSIILLALSIGVKFATAFLLPVYGLVLFSILRKKTINWNRTILLIVTLMIFPVVFASFRTNFQPWYLLDVLPFAALLPAFYIFIPSIAISVFALFEYLPFLYLGNWDKPVPLILNWMTFSSIILSILLILAWKLRKVVR